MTTPTQPTWRHPLADGLEQARKETDQAIEWLNIGGPPRDDADDAAWNEFHALCDRSHSHERFLLSLNRRGELEELIRTIPGGLSCLAPLNDPSTTEDPEVVADWWEHGDKNCGECGPCRLRAAYEKWMEASGPIELAAEETKP